MEIMFYDDVLIVAYCVLINAFAIRAQLYGIIACTAMFSLHMISAFLHACSINYALRVPDTQGRHHMATTIMVNNALGNGLTAPSYHLS